MANISDNRPLPKSGAESEFDRGVGAVPYKVMASTRTSQDTQNIWIYVIIGLLIAGGGVYYYMNYNLPSAMTPEITQTTPPPVTTEPEVVTPPALTTEPPTPPVVTPDPSTAPKTTP